MQTQPKRIARTRRLALGLLLIVALIGTTSALALANPGPTAQPDTPTINWQIVHNTPGVYWYTLSFPTPSVGYAIGGADWNDPSSGIGPVTLAKTTDGGQTWTSSIVPNTNRFMRGLTCTDASHCWIAGASSPRIQYTANGGASWSPGTIVNNVWTPWLWSAGWTGSGTTILAGTTGYSDEPGRRANILRATDGVNFNAVVANDPREFVVYDFSCPVPGTCYAAAKQTAFYTSDNAATLIRRVLPVARYYGIWCTDASTCWEVGGSNGGTTDGVFYIYRTVDSGLTWQIGSGTPLTGNRPRLWNVQMVDAQHGYAVGCTNAADPILETCNGQGLLLRTDDGVTWQPVPSPTTADIMDLRVTNMDNLVIVDWSGKIWRGQTAPPTSVTLTSLGAGGQSSRLPFRTQTGIPVVVVALSLAVAYVLSRKH